MEELGIRITSCCFKRQPEKEPPKPVRKTSAKVNEFRFCIIFSSLKTKCDHNDLNIRK